MGWRHEWKPYVPVAVRRAKATKHAATLAKKRGKALAPISIEGRKIAKSFWGDAWCKSLERHSDFSNRLPRGASYVRNGSVIDLQIEPGQVKALVSGSEVYTVTIRIEKLPAAAWSRIRSDCAQSIDSLIDLLQGKFDQAIMERLTRRDGGLFPLPREIKPGCTCPDWANVCKHVAAAFYGIGARLDVAPELLFKLRGVDHLELIGQAVSAENLNQALGAGRTGTLADENLGELFGIELETTSPAPASPSVKRKRVANKPSSESASSAVKKASKRSTAGKIAKAAVATPAKPVNKPRSSLRRDPLQTQSVPPPPRGHKKKAAGAASRRTPVTSSR